MTVPNNMIQVYADNQHRLESPTPLSPTNKCSHCRLEHQVTWIEIPTQIVTKSLSFHLPFVKLQQECCFFQRLAHFYSPHSVLNKFRDMILEPSNSRLQVQVYVNDLSISHQYLNKLFRQELKYSLHHLVTKRNLLVIKLKLIQLNEPVKDICNNLGYSDVSNFNKFFKKHMGITPYSYRNIWVYH